MEPLKIQEKAKILEVIAAAYSQFIPTKERLNLWHLMLEDVSYEVAAKRLKKHIASQPFPPAISDIVSGDRQQAKRFRGDPDAKSPAAIMGGNQIYIPPEFH